MNNKCLLARIRGRVQGVSFRYHTRAMAEELGIRGWVRNLPDGSVEALICGNADRIEAMKRWLAHGPAWAEVDDVHFESASGKDMPPGFRIR